eukprot:4266080-Alexandrium_andersonii.AAC.1
MLAPKRTLCKITRLVSRTMDSADAGTWPPDSGTSARMIPRARDGKLSETARVLLHLPSLPPA